MRLENKDFFLDALSTAGAVLFLVLLCAVPMFIIFAWVMAALYEFAYWISSENFMFIFVSTPLFAFPSAFWLYPKIKEEMPNLKTRFNHN